MKKKSKNATNLLPKLPPLPKEIYGHWNIESGNDAENRFLSTDVRPETAIELGKTMRVGVYRLVGYATVTNETNVITKFN